MNKLSRFEWNNIIILTECKTSKGAKHGLPISPSSGQPVTKKKKENQGDFHPGQASGNWAKCAESLDLHFYRIIDVCHL